MRPHIEFFYLILPDSLHRNESSVFNRDSRIKPGKSKNITTLNMFKLNVAKFMFTLTSVLRLRVTVCPTDLLRGSVEQQVPLRPSKRQT